jgi:excisionase family DNA binding protein
VNREILEITQEAVSQPAFSWRLQVATGIGATIMNAVTLQRTPVSARLRAMSERIRARRSHTLPSGVRFREDVSSQMPRIPQEAESPPRLLTLQQVGKILRVGRTTVWEMVNSGELTAVRLRGKLLIPCEEPERYLAELIEDGRASAATRRAARRKSPTVAGSRR